MCPRKPNDQCSVCGDLVYRRPGYKKQYPISYCPKCIVNRSIDGGNSNRDKQYNQYIERWKASLENGMSGKSGTSAHIKRYLKEKYDNSCQICGWSEVSPSTGRVPLETHHIDGDITNNKEENLELICPNCHSLTPTYRSQNKNSKRPRCTKL